MKHRLLSSVAMILVLSLTGVAKEQFYRFTTGTNSTITRWSLLEEGFHVTRIFQDGDEVHTTIYDGSSATSFHIQDPSQNRDITANRDSLTLHISGTDGKKIIQSTTVLDGSPWFQSMSYSLSRFSLTPQNDIVFWVLRTDNLKMHRMRAEKQQIEEITANGIRYTAQRIRVLPTGIWGKFWCCTYWFRVKDGLFLRYEGTNGPPGTPKTIIEFLH